MNGIIYCRVSSDEQVQGTSLESQEIACREYARANNIHVSRVFIEQGESAKFADRTQLIELIDFCRDAKGQIERLIVWKVDRFSRIVEDYFALKATLLKYGVRIVSVTEPIDTSPEGRLMETMLAGFAQFDNDLRAMRTVQGMRRKLQEGIFPWKPPLGYQSPVRESEKKTRPDEPHEQMFAPVQKAWKAFITGAYTKAEIGRLLTASGVVTEKGRPLSAQSIDNLLRNSYYAGVLVDPWSGEEYEGRHQPMISREEFMRVQDTIHRRNRSIPHQKDRPQFPLRGFARCGTCQHYFTGGFSRGRSRRYAYYLCNERGCGHRGKSHAVETMHSEFVQFLDEVAPKPGLLEKLGQSLADEAGEREAKSKTRRKRLDGEISSLRSEVQELISMKARHLITDQEFVTQKSILIQKQAALEARRAQTNIDNQEVLRQLREITQPLVELRQSWQALPCPFQRRFERLVLPAGFVQGQIRTAERALLFAVFRQSETPKSTGVPLAGALLNRILAEIKAFWQLLKEYQAEPGTSKEAVQTYSNE